MPRWETFRFVTSRPQRWTVPASGRRRPQMASRMVVLPLPVRPMRTPYWPGGTSRVTPVTANAPARRVRFWRRIMAKVRVYAMNFGRARGACNSALSHTRLTDLREGRLPARAGEGAGEDIGILETHSEAVAGA